MKFKKILSAGCSFIQGNELGDEFPFSYHTYPALLAKNFAVDYDSIAYASASNQGIAKRIFEYKNYDDTLVIVQWTFPSRLGVNLSYEYRDKNHMKQEWLDLSPNNWDLSDRFEGNEDYTQQLKNLQIDQLTSTAYKHFGNDKHFNFYTQLCIKAVKDFLRENNVNYLFFCTTPVGEANKFDNKGFVEWCEKNNFAKGKYHHPLHDAHKSACQYILDKNLIS